MRENTPQGLWYRVLVLWYRLLGATLVQAEWRARRAARAPDQVAQAVRGEVRRAADPRFRCVCGQLLVRADKVCHACGRRQLLPFPIRRLMQTLGLLVPEAAPGTMLVGFLMGVGYLAQIRFGSGGLMAPTNGLETIELGSAMPGLLAAQPWRAFTYTMLHGGLMHVGFNGFALAQVGPLVEGRFGTGRFLLGWFVTAAVAVILPVGLGQSHPIVGASGAVFGLIGMAMLRGHLDGDARGRMIRDVMVRWTLYTTVFGLMIGGIAHSAHFAGLAAGAGLALVLPPVDGHPERRRLSPLLGGMGVAGMAASLIVFGLWRASGGLPPDDTDPSLAVPLYLAMAEQRGAEAVLDAPGWALVEEAERVRSLAADTPGARSFLSRVETYFDSAPAGRAAVLRRELARVLAPEPHRGAARSPPTSRPASRGDPR